MRILVRVGFTTWWKLEFNSPSTTAAAATTTTTTTETPPPPTTSTIKLSNIITRTLKKEKVKPMDILRTLLWLMIKMSGVSKGPETPAFFRSSTEPTKVAPTAAKAMWPKFGWCSLVTLAIAPPKEKRCLYTCAAWSIRVKMYENDHTCKFLEDTKRAWTLATSIRR